MATADDLATEHLKVVVVASEGFVGESLPGPIE